jgi:endonuclease/exonuclease/phosphatase family metal-dependent hydrolase
VRALLEAMADPFLDVCIVAGDFNEWLPGSRSLRGLDRHFGVTPRFRTFPSRRPALALDRIWVHPPDALTDVAVHTTPLSRVASDHLPIRARITWPDSSRSQARSTST